MTDTPGAGDPEWTALLHYLQASRGFDFHGYKTNTLARRIRKRGFFRDPAAWDALHALAIPAIVGVGSAEEPIRAWSAGCASGEEACTIAMLLAEALGPDRYRDRVTIYATYVDEEALDTARQASYDATQVAGVPAELLDRYFERANGRYVFRPEFRRQVIYGRHDLLSDAPISRIDLLVCRNTLMYFNADTQARVLDRLHFALNDGGFLLLGRAETLTAQGGAFAPVDPKCRLSRKTGDAVPRMRRHGGA